MLGKIDEFTPGQGSWRTYFKRFDSWIQVNEVPAEKQTRVFIAIMGSQAYETLSTLVGGREVEKLSIYEINSYMLEHFDPTPIAIAERYRLYTSKQLNGETFKEFGLRLQKISEQCDFGPFLEEALRDAFILGMEDPKKNIRVSRSKTEAIEKIEIPTTVDQVRSFCGLINYYRNHINGLADIISPLYDLLKKDSAFTWGSVQQQSFDKAKKSLQEAVVLAHFDPGLPLVLATDASSKGIGAVLSHVLKNGHERPISMASRILSSSEQNYSTIEKETLAIVWAVKKFQQYLEGTNFSIVTDHRPLMYILNQAKGIPQTAAARIQRWAIFLSGFTFSIKYRKASENTNADALSRLPIHEKRATKSNKLPLHHIQELGESITYETIEEATRKDNILCRVSEMHSNDWNAYSKGGDLDHYYARRDQISKRGDCLLFMDRLLIPKSLRHSILRKLHDSHLGLDKTKALSRLYVWWPKIDEDIKSTIDACNSCSLMKRKAPSAAPIKSWKPADFPMHRIFVDFLGPLSGKLILVAIDDFTKWPEAIIMKDTTTEETIREIMLIFSRLGVPKELVSDNGPQFSSHLFSKFMTQHNIIHKRTPPFHPSSNGTAERFVQTLKGALANTNVTGLHGDLNKFLVGYRNAPHATTLTAPAIRMFGRRVRTWMDNLTPAERDNRHDVKGRRFVNGDKVLVRMYSKNYPKWQVGSIENVLGDRNYTVTVGGRAHHRHIDQLLKYNGSLAITAPGSIYTATTPEGIVEQSVMPPDDTDITSEVRSSYQPSTVCTPESLSYYSDYDDFDI
ncbi:Transposon Tf2-6 polyprotein [Thelohanellus kitauei]|uniref:Transposon Tf2-6 polyprotein n=1 Tax=Thelohanellus kitauei TaxID=669202 RepID=A0A0C2MQB5_THEKT|nr:Transposon Tf2-6 polyprotein [Thelohanellus kitauei]